jgi:AmmeMemoRadiSam system protein B
MLPPLRVNLDFFPSPVEDRPGLVIRDPFQYSDATLIVPPALVACLECFDGQHSELDLRALLVRITGDVQSGELARHLMDTLSAAAFLQDDNFEGRKAEAERDFATSDVRQPAHAGSGYPADPEALSETLKGYLGETADLATSAPSDGRVVAVAAPHVSPFGGIEAYRAAYSALSPAAADRTFVILGTSHYGEPDRIGLTRKPFRTPFGDTAPDLAIVDELARTAGAGAAMEDYCHAVEHSIEFQVVFLQHLFGPRIRVVPVLCGSYATSFYRGGYPEGNESVRRVLGALGELAAREGDRLLWVLGIDMAHMGKRYGDQFAATADRGEMELVARRDHSRMERMENGDAPGFWDLVRENHDDLKWCGAAPIYTFLKAVPGARGHLLRYQQWNIDEHSVVSFAGMRFHSH